MPNPNIIVFINDPTVIRNSPLKLDEGLRPRRIVLRKLPGKFVTHDEYMHIAVETHFMWDKSARDHVVCRHECFDQGNYFEFHNEASEKIALTKAQDDFEKRLARF